VPAEPSAADLLSAWEEGLAREALERPLALLAAVRPGESLDRLARLPIGRRDAELLALRRRVFGAHVSSVAVCPACSERLELAFDLDDVAAPADPDASETYTVAAEGHTATFRLPTTADLAEVRHDDLERVRLALLERCVERAEAGGRRVPAARLPPPVVSAVEERMERADPQADVTLELACPACGHGWEERFDAATFLWEELSAWARHLLCDVADLARAYGWSEAEILAMSPARRQAYLDLAGT